MNVAIIGGGAAGMMAAASVLETNPQAEIFLIEKNEALGKKVIISGGGRCNVTTGIFDVRTVLTRYPRGNKFLSSAMYSFPPEKVYAWFEAGGVPLKIEEDLRIFPQSNNGKDVVGVFERLFASSNVNVLLRSNIIKVEAKGGKFKLTQKDDFEEIIVDRLILTTGGQAYRQTGSTGDGYAFAQALGHTITPLAASLNAFFTEETWMQELSGLSFEKAKITAKVLNDPSWTGPFLFTHKGVSGPAVFAVSSLVASVTYDKTQPLGISIDLFPDLSLDELLASMMERIAENTKKNIANALVGRITKSLTEAMCRQLGLSLDKHAAEFSKKELVRCVAWLKGIPLNVVARGAGDEFVTAGGVDLKEVNPSTMESKIHPGLFFAGEILDVDGFTGGFNLQASWATGRLAGQHASGP